MLGRDVTLTIAANKMDLERQRQVDEAAAEKYAESVGASHIHTSAKADRNVNELFLDVTRRMIEVRDAAAGAGSAARDDRRGASGIIIEQDERADPPAKKGGCC